MLVLEATRSATSNPAFGDDGFFRLECPSCGKLLFRYDPMSAVVLQLKCPRSGRTVTGSRCAWQDTVYINVTPKES